MIPDGSDGRTDILVVASQVSARRIVYSACRKPWAMWFPFEVAPREVLWRPLQG